MRKPGAFENYRSRDDLFPTTRFRMAYDYLIEKNQARANKEYLKILYLAAKETETGVDEALCTLFASGQAITFEAVKELLESNNDIAPPKEVNVEEIAFSQYDQLLRDSTNGEVAYGQQG